MGGWGWSAGELWSPPQYNDRGFRCEPETPAVRSAADDGADALGGGSEVRGLQSGQFLFCLGRDLVDERVQDAAGLPGVTGPASEPSGMTWPARHMTARAVPPLRTPL